jgi:TolB-like protein/Tfp pilus assembly protein PilF
MGVIYRARERGLNRTVALKMILPQQLQSAAAIQRFRSEAEAVAALDHPGILPIYEVGELDGLPFFSMKLAEKGSLASEVANYRERPREAARLIAHVARAIHHAHDRGILHRDLKPGNILLGREGEAYVTDFGIAKWVARASHLTLDASTLGTPHYIAPEQAAGGSTKLTPAGDVYSLGAILYELVAGRPPFVAESALETLRLVRETVAPSPRTFNPSIPRELEVICLKCLEKEPSARYASASAFAQDLERWLEGETVLARPTTSIKRALRWTKRNRVVAGLSGALFLALLTMAVAWSYLHRRSSQPLPSEAPAKSIAVLPFENRSDDKQNVYFVDGVQDEILTRLAKIADLKVIGRASVMSYTIGARRDLREIGKQLGVVHILEGSVQREGGKVRVNAQLINALTGVHEWAENYDRPIDDVFAIQSEIAKKIADQLQAKISPREKIAMSRVPTTDLIANELYVQAKGFFHSAANDPNGRQGLLDAVRLLDKAVARDPHFLLAYCVLARTHLELYWDGVDHTPARRELANAAIENASRLEPDAGEVHLAQADYAYHGFRDYDRARAELDRARDLLPNDVDALDLTALIDRRQGRWAEATRTLERAAELDPLNFGLLSDAATTAAVWRRYPEAARLFERALKISPRDYGMGMRLALMLFGERADLRPLRDFVSGILSEDAAAAKNIAFGLFYLALFERDSAGMPRALAAISPAGMQMVPGNFPLPQEYYAGLAAHAFNDAAMARSSFTTARAIVEKLVREQPDYAPAWSALGLIDAGLGRKEEAIAEGRRACQLLPLSRDAVDAPAFITNLAIVYAWTGEKDLAFEQLVVSTRIPNGVTYGDLKLNPQWDVLRGDPRLEALLVKMGPSKSSQAPGAPEKSIAVLPFVDLSQAKDQEYFCDGISEELLDKLAKVEGLQVVSRTSSFFFKGKNADLAEIARKLNVQSVLEGSVRRDGSRVRINAQLVNVRDGLQLWSETYEREVQDIFAVQDNITKAIVDALKVRLTAALPSQKQHDPEAYDLYLRGLYFSNKSSEEDLRKSLSFFQRALDKDPNFARAWTGIAKSWQWLADEYVKPLEAYPISLAAASKAIALDEGEAEAHAYLGESERVLNWDYRKEESELRRAIEIDPNCAPAHMFLALLLAMDGRADEEFAELATAKRLDPLTPIVSSFTAELFLSANRFDDALAEARRMNELDPTFSYFDDSLAATYRERGDLARAIDLYEKAEAVTHVLRPGLAIAYARAGRLDDARRVLVELIERSKTHYVAADGIASIYVALGDNDEAFRWLDRAVDEHSAPLEGIGQRITFRALRSDPRFADILRRIKLDPDKVLPPR